MLIGTRVQVAANPAPRWHFPGWTGEVSGSEPRQAVVMDAAKSLAAVFARSEPLRPGAMKDVTLRTSGRFQLHGGRDGYDVLVPPDAAELTLRFRSSSAAEADLYVRRGSEVRSEPGDAGETPRIHADFESPPPPGRQREDRDQAGIDPAHGERRLAHRPRRPAETAADSGNAVGGFPAQRERQGLARRSHVRVPCRVRPGTADDPTQPRGNRRGPLQDRFERNLAPGQPAGMGPRGNRRARGSHGNG